MVPIPLVFRAAILGNPFLGTKYQSSITQQREKKVKVTNVTHSNIFENANPLHENRMTAPEAGLTRCLPWHINPPIICITFDLKTCLIKEKENLERSFQKFP